MNAMAIELGVPLGWWGGPVCVTSRALGGFSRASQREVTLSSVACGCGVGAAAPTEPLGAPPERAIAYRRSVNVTWLSSVLSVPENPYRSLPFNPAQQACSQDKVTPAMSHGSDWNVRALCWMARERSSALLLAQGRGRIPPVVSQLA